MTASPGPLLPEPDWDQLERERDAWRVAHPPTTYQDGLFELSLLGPAAHEAVMAAWDGEPETLCAALAAGSTLAPMSVSRPEPDDVADWLMAPPQQLHPRATAEPVAIHSFSRDVPAKRMKPLTFRTAREIAAMTADDVAFAAAFLVFGAITELDGKPKAAGKTTYVLAMTRAILQGTPFLDRATVAGPIVMLTEQPPASLKAALVRAGLTERDDFVLLSWADAAGTPWPEIVAAAAAKCAEIGARVLLVDTLPQFAGLRGDTENNAGHALEAIEPLQRLAADGLAILVTRHDRKGGGEVGESARGSGAFTGAVDIVVALGRNAHDPRPTMRRLVCLSRFTETPPDLIVELIDGHYVVLGSIDDVTADAANDHVLAALPDAGEEGLPIPTLVEALDESEATIRATLNALLRDVPPRVRRDGSGRKGDPYRWSKPTQDGAVLPFVSLRETHERNEPQPLPGPNPIWSAGPSEGAPS